MKAKSQGSRVRSGGVTWASEWANDFRVAFEAARAAASWVLRSVLWAQSGEISGRQERRIESSGVELSWAELNWVKSSWAELSPEKLSWIFWQTRKLYGLGSSELFPSSAAIVRLQRNRNIQTRNKRKLRANDLWANEMKQSKTLTSVQSLAWRIFCTSHFATVRFLSFCNSKIKLKN